MSITNVTPRRTAVNPRGRQLLFGLIAVLIVIFIVNAFMHRENAYEKLARGVTNALVANDLDGVKKYQNAETATTINRGIVGRAADTFAPLGKLKRVKETTPATDAPRVHEFDISFDKGTVHEKMKVDPDNKIVRFQYNVVTP